MGTGDLKNCANQLRVALRQGKYNKDVNYEYIMYGYPQEFLPLLHYVFLQYSVKIAKFLLTKGYELSGKSDAVFIETVYKVMRVEFSYIPKINKEKFFLNGFAEQKILFVVNVVNKIMEKNKMLNKIHAKKKAKRLDPRAPSHKYEDNTDLKENCIPNKQQPLQQQPLQQQPPQQQPPQQQPFRSKDYPDPQLDDSLYITTSVAPRCYEGVQYSNIEDDHWGQSLILQHLAPQPALIPQPSFPPPEKTYTESKARDIYPTHESVDEEVDCTPFNTITNVQCVPIKETSPVDVVVVKPNFDVAELDDMVLEDIDQTEATITVKNSAQNTSCVSCSDLKQLIMSLTARLDVLECRVTTLEGPQKMAVLRDQEYAQSSHHVSLAPPNEIRPAPILSATARIHAPDVTGRASKDMSTSSEHADDASSDDPDDLQDFIVSVQKRLQNQKSILDGYSAQP